MEDETGASRLVERVLRGDFDPEEIVGELDGLPRAQSRQAISEILHAFRGKVTILDLASSLAPKLELRPLIQDIIFKITQVLEAERSSLFLIDRERQELWSTVAEGLEQQEIRFPLTTGIAGKVATTGETLLIEDAYEHPLFNKEFDRRTGFRTRSILCVPIRSIKKEIIGVVQVMNKQGGLFSHRDADMLTGINYVLALTLENSLLYERVMQSQRQVATLLKVANALNAHLDLTTLIQTIMSKASELMNADRASLFLIDRETGELYSRVAQGIEVPEIRSPMNKGIAGHVATTGETIKLADAYESPLFNKEFDKKTGYRTRTILCQPIRNGQGEIMGVTQVINKKNGPFVTGDEELLSAFSAQASIAIENAQLYERTMNQKNFFESILRSLSNAVITVDSKGIITAVNQAAQRLMRRETADLIGKAAGVALAANPGLVERIERVRTADATVADYDHELIASDGAKVTANLSVVPLYDIRERRTGVVVVMEDITREKRIKSNLTRFMAKDLVDKVLSEHGQISLGGVRQEVTVLFSDIRNFTGITEHADPQAIVEMLNEYFAEMVDAVFKYRGVLDKFIGDAIMAIFGAPLPLPDHPFMACQSALEMRRQLTTFNAGRVARGHPGIQIGIGLSTGHVICGNIGSEKRMEYTAIGDGVNLASRLEGANKYYGTDIIISEFTYAPIKDLVQVRELDCVRVKGRGQPAKVYELLGLSGDSLPDERRELLNAFNAALGHYRERRWQDAVHAFEKLVSTGEDRLSRLYLDRCKHYSHFPPGDDWDGVWALTEK